MVILGIDAHKRTHTVVAIDDTGRELDTKTTLATTTEAHLELVRWADRFGAERRWAVEDCRHLSRRLEADLLAAGEGIVRVPPKLMAHARDAARTYGKSDPIDALAVASPVRSATMVWKFSSASSRPCEISGWYGVYAVYHAGFSSTLRRMTGGVIVP